jgi:DNA-binding transcriptional LysR family regulator
MNYTQAAERLYITQPAVTQHIQYLENLYGARLFIYDRKRLSITPEGKALCELVFEVDADVMRLRSLIQDNKLGRKRLHLGASGSIGEYVLPPLLQRLAESRTDTQVCMKVDTTQALLADLKRGILSFVFVEGLFDKTQFGVELFSREPFIGICSPKSPLVGREINFDAILAEKFILPEKKFSIREIFEQLLGERNLSIENLDVSMELGSMSAIKQLVAKNAGISFFYQAAVRQDLQNGALCKLDIAGFDIQREFNFVYLKGRSRKGAAWFEIFSRLGNK